MPRTKGLARELGIRDYYIEYWKGRSSWLLPIRYLRQSLETLAILRRERPRLIIVTNPPILLPLIAWLAARWLKAELVIDSHTTAITGKWRRILFLHRFVSRRALATLVTNEPLREIVASWRAPAYVLQDRVPDLPVAPTKPNSHFSVGVISLVADDEPLSAILAAAASLPEYRFLITGRVRPQLDPYLARTPPNVTYTGFLTGADYVGLLNRVDAVMVLDTEDYTVLCGAYEAVAVEKPLITSDWPVLKSYFSAGALYVDNSPESIRNAVMEADRCAERLRSEMRGLKRLLKRDWDDRFAAIRTQIQRALAGEEILASAGVKPDNTPERATG
jgi:glycosyltransferase involved in cell wall biosynthesis